MRVQRREASSFAPLVSTAEWGGRATRAEINLDAVAANVAALRSHARSRDLMAVVKADAYGHGAAQVARTALVHGASWLGVYTVDEGARLRRSGIESPILVFGPFQPAEARLMVDFDLTPTLISRSGADAIAAAAAGRTVGYHVKIDTGLARSGICPEDAADLLRHVARLPALQREGIFTHFARADEPEEGTTREQLHRLLEVRKALAAAGYDFPLVHVSNSAATLLYPEMHLSMVRCGISIYGYYPSSEVDQVVPLTPALQLVTAVTRVHHLSPGAGVGYGHEFRCSRDTVLALAPIGYGDGLPRCLGGGNGTAIVRGAQVPIVGRVSMDQITLDVTDVQEVVVGDRVTLIGSDGEAVQTAEDVARQAGTISYDILTGIMPRVPRIYVERGQVVGDSREAAP